MIIELLPEVGQAPIRLTVSQIVVRQDNGTPIYVAAHYGPDGAYAASSVGDADFNRMLRVLGVNMTVLVEKLMLPQAPAGARLIAGPKT